MSRVRFLGDHDLKDPIVDGLLRVLPEAEFWRARELGLARHADVDLLEAAASAGLIIVSHDVNTMRASAYARVRAGQLMPGLLLVHQVSPVGPVVRSLALIWSASEAEEWYGEVAFLPL